LEYGRRAPDLPPDRFVQRRFRVLKSLRPPSTCFSAGDTPELYLSARIAFTAVTPAKGAFMRLRGPISVISST